MKQHSQGLVRLILVLLVILLFGGCYLADPKAFHEIWSLLKEGEIISIADYIRSFGKGAAVFAFVLTAVMNAVGFPPAMIFSTACTLIFGIVPGILLAWVAETVGAGISFLFFRTFLRTSAEELIAKNKKLSEWDEKSRTNGFRVMLIARVIPYFPAAALNAFGALSKMSFKDYLLASFIGKFPATAIEALIGHDTVTISQNPHRLGVVIAISILLYVVFFIWDRRSRKAAE